MAILELKQVTKSFGEVRAVRGIDLSVGEGSIYGFLGPNGAGKTTTIRMIMQIILPDTGEIRLFGQKQKLTHLDRVGYLPEERGLYRKMKVADLMHFFGELRNIPHREINKKIAFWLERFQLFAWRDKKVEELSRGMQQKLQFILTIFHQPRLIILDEPFTGLDPVNAQLVKDTILEEHKRGATIIFSTHLMEQVEKLCDHICLINKGEIILEGDMLSIKRRFGKDHLILSYKGKPDFLRSPAVASFDDYGQYVEVRLNEGHSPRDFLQKALQSVEITRFEVAEPSMHEIFLQMVQGKEVVHA